MGRHLAYFAIALLTFGLGSAVPELFYRAAVGGEIQPSPVGEVQFQVQNLPRAKRELKYGCESEGLEQVWEELDLDAMMELKRREIRVWTMDPEFTSQPSRERYEADWKELQSGGLDCSMLKSIDEEIDLDVNGEAEIVVQGRSTSNRGDVERYIFQKTSGKWKPILFDIGNDEFVVRSKRTLGYPELRFKTVWFTSGGRKITYYRFNGKAYVASKCFFEAEANGESDTEKPVLNRTGCSSLNSLLE